jgi:hypothetical protein
LLPKHPCDLNPLIVRTLVALDNRLVEDMVLAVDILAVDIARTLPEAAVLLRLCI